MGTEDGWSVVESSVKIDKLDNSVASGIVSALSIWKANDFADGVKLADAGLEPPALTVTVGLKGDKKVTALIGNKKGEDEYYVKTPEAPQVFLVKKYNVDRVIKRPDRVPRQDPVRHRRQRRRRDRGDPRRQLVHARQERQRLEGDQAGQAGPRPGQGHASRRAFKEWKAQSFAEDATAKTNGLAKPQATITAKGKAKGATCTVKVGDETKDKLNYYVMSGERARRLPGAQVERRPRPGQGRRPQEGLSRSSPAAQARWPRPRWCMPFAAQNPHGRPR